MCPKAKFDLLRSAPAWMALTTSAVTADGCNAQISTDESAYRKDRWICTPNIPLSALDSSNIFPLAPVATMAHRTINMYSGPASARDNRDIGHGRIFDSAALSSPATPGQLPLWSSQGLASQYRLPPSEVLKSLANRFVHSTAYIYLYGSMALASFLTVILSLMSECPGTMFYLIEMAVNVVLVLEVSLRFIAFGGVSKSLCLLMRPAVEALDADTLCRPPVFSCTAILAFYVQHSRSFPCIPMHLDPNSDLLLTRLLSIQSREWRLEQGQGRTSGQRRGAARLSPPHLPQRHATHPPAGNRPQK